jgi:hypothetical protein
MLAIERPRRIMYPRAPWSPVSSLLPGDGKKAAFCTLDTSLVVYYEDYELHLSQSVGGCR